MSKHHKKDTAIYTSETAPAEFDDKESSAEDTSNIDSSSTDLSNSENTTDGSEVLTSQDVNTLETEDTSENDDVDETEKVFNDNKSSNSDIPDTFFQNLIKTRIIGEHRNYGTHLMYPVGIANAVIENTGAYTVINSLQTAEAIAKIIRCEKDKLSIKDMSDENRELHIKRYIADCKRFSM